MSFVKEFKEFAMKGNVLDMAVGVVIGAAFGKIVSSLVGDIVTPVLGKVLGGVNFKDLAWSLGTDPAGRGDPGQVRDVPAEPLRLHRDRRRDLHGTAGSSTS